jgi:hypothetical protein
LRITLSISFCDSLTPSSGDFLPEITSCIWVPSTHYR